MSSAHPQQATTSPAGTALQLEPQQEKKQDEVTKRSTESIFILHMSTSDVGKTAMGAAQRGWITRLAITMKKKCFHYISYL